MKKKTALITGIAGQDGSHLADFLLEKDYHVVGVIRRNATRNLENASHLEGWIDFEEGDITDMSSMLRIIQKTKPQELYSLAAQSHVHTSFEQPLATFQIDAVGPINILEAVKILGYNTKIYHASTSELYGSSSPPQDEETVLQPRSPYAIAKLSSHWMVRLYREAYNMFCCSGMVFNHEGPRRGPLFVTRKISMGVARCLQDPSFKLKLGNLDAARDWGYAKDFVEAFWLMLQQKKPDDYVIATGEMRTVREFTEEAFSYVGLDWKKYVEVDKSLKRPAEVEMLCGNPEKAKRELGWEPKTNFRELVHLMVDHDCALFGVSKQDNYKSEYDEKNGERRCLR